MNIQDNMKNINKIFLLLAININAMEEEKLFNKNNEVYEESENNKEISDIFYKNINYKYNIPEEEISNKIPEAIPKKKYYIEEVNHIIIINNKH